MKGLRRRDVAGMLQTLFEQRPNESFDVKSIFRILGLTTHPARQMAVDILMEMAQDDLLQCPEYMVFRQNTSGHIMTGTFTRKANGKNIFQDDKKGRPILVAERNSLHALTGDRVQAVLLARRKNHCREAQITEILERAENRFIGLVRGNQDFCWLKTDDKSMAQDIILPKRYLKGAVKGDKVVVVIVEWPEDSKNPIGKVVDVLGKAGDNNTEMHAILAEYGLPYKYPANVEAAADAISDVIPEEEIARREDMRDVMTFTIDPRDAKDFDDAISIREAGKGLWEVGVHIADVSHYVTEGSVIDREAVKRATSVYLVDRTIPMLPERLCNRICSLRPDEDKLTYSVIFVMDERGNVRTWHIAHTVTRSNRRFTYEEVQKVLEDNGEASAEDLGKPGDHPGPVYEGAAPAEDFAFELITLNRIAKELRRERFAKGAVNFERAEPRFEIDEKGKPTSVYFKFAKDANKLVEEFMLLANRTVAESVGRVGKGKTAKTLPYRIHDKPDEGKLMNLADMAARFGVRFRVGKTAHETNKAINRMLAEVHDRPEENMLSMLTLRSMAKAVYSTVNIGHYGLGFQYYTHFTSPIRRYPDLMVHRLLTRYAEGARSAAKDKYEELCEHCSDMEQTAAKAERDSIKYKQVEFMGDKLGVEYDGVITGVTEWGLYVEIKENKCEGLVPLRDLNDDYYDFDERNFCLVGRRKRNRYSLGDEVRIKVAQADLERKQLDYALVKG